MRFTGAFEWEQQAAIEFAHLDINVKLALMAQPSQPPRFEDVERFVTATNMYGVEVSAATVSTVTDKVWGLVEAWQNRPLARVYPIV
jgi:hypothetical protein